MTIEGDLKKMRTEPGDPVQYYLELGEREISMNDLVGRLLQMEYLGEIHCIRCGRKTSRSFAQGYCYPCFTTAPETEECVLRPELCRAHEGQARDMQYAQEHCLIEHVVYLSYTSGIKVGVTRNTQVPYRWIDQGAVRAIELARTPNRYTAGTLEVFFKDHMKDTTNWRRMLKEQDASEVDLREQKKAALSLLPPDMNRFASANDQVTEIRFPVTRYPVKVGSLNLDKNPVVRGTLTGIKGQYLMFDDDKVINIRKFGGYKVRLGT